MFEIVEPADRFIQRSFFAVDGCKIYLPSSSLCTILFQKLCDIPMSKFLRVLDGGMIARISAPYIGSARQQKPNDIGPARARRNHQRGDLCCPRRHRKGSLL
jgi:hypothetical protein